MGERWDDEKAAAGEPGLWFGADGEELEPSDPFRAQVEAFNRCAQDKGEFPRIFSELGFTFVDDGCDGTCPDCDREATCEVVPELKAEWEELE